MESSWSTKPQQVDEHVAQNLKEKSPDMLWGKWDTFIHSSVAQISRAVSSDAPKYRGNESAVPQNVLPIEKHCSVGKFYHRSMGWTGEHLKGDGPRKDWGCCMYDHNQLFVICVDDIRYRVHPDTYCELFKRR
jgi:hypothetical protein